MKGIAILIVVFAHILLFTFDMADSKAFKFCASFEMPLFMFVSGFVAYIQPFALGGGKKLASRFVSYLCPALMVTYMVDFYSLLILGNQDIDLVATLTGGFWYLKALAVFVCLQAFMLKCKNIWLEFIIIALAEMMFLVGWKTSPFLHQLFCLEHCFFFYPFFMMGYYFRRLNMVEKLKSRNWIFTMSVIGFICLLNAHFDTHVLRFLSDRIFMPVFAVVAITYLFALREEKNSRTEEWLNKIGTRTLDIYIYHGFFIMGASSCFDLKMLKQSEVIMANPLIYLAIALLITLVLAYVSMAIGMLVRKSNLLEKVIYGRFV